MKKLELKEKSWSEAEIKQAQDVLEREEHHDVFFSKIVFWTALVVVVIANILVSLILIPFLIVFNTWILYSLVVILSGTMGFLYNFLITDIGHLRKHHHILASIFLPILAVGNMVVVVIFSNKFIVDLKVDNALHNPWIIAIVFAVVFILPFILMKVFRRN